MSEFKESPFQGSVILQWSGIIVFASPKQLTELFLAVPQSFKVLYVCSAPHFFKFKYPQEYQKFLNINTPNTYPTSYFSYLSSTKIERPLTFSNLFPFCHVLFPASVTFPSLALGICRDLHISVTPPHINGFFHTITIIFHSSGYPLRQPPLVYQAGLEYPPGFPNPAHIILSLIHDILILILSLSLYHGLSGS